MRKPRLRRLDEIHQEQPIFFITFCTFERRPLLADSKLHDSFEAFCVKYRERQNLVGRYVIMPNHVHLFLMLKEPCDLSKWIKSLKNALSKTLRSMGHPAPHWQKDFFDHILRSEESYGSKWEYVEHNRCGQAWLPKQRTGPIKEKSINSALGDFCSGGL